MNTRPFARVPQGVVPFPPLPSPENNVEIFLDAIVKLLTEIRDELREQVQKGYVYPFTQVVVGFIPVFVSFAGTELFSIGLTNDGPATVQYKVPYDTQAAWVDLFPTEVVVFNFVKGKVHSVGFRVNGPGTATVRGIGTY